MKAHIGLYLNCCGAIFSNFLQDFTELKFFILAAFTMNDPQSMNQKTQKASLSRGKMVGLPTLLLMPI